MNVDWKRRLHTGGQIEVFHDSHRFKVLACGTRWGKTRLCANIVIDKGLKNKIDIWWVAPTYDLADRGLAGIYDSAPRELFGKPNKVKKILPMVSGTEIQFRTADNPVSLLGKGIHLLIIDEAAQIRNEIWYRYLRRTLLDHKGDAIFISTPKSKNWFYEMFCKGQDELQDEFKSWSFPSGSNPILDQAELAKIEADLPDLIWRQEYMAEFLDEANQVFRNIEGCVSGKLQEPVPMSTYSMGVDLAKYQDFTVITVMNEDGHVVYYDRFNQLDWGFQKARIKVAAEKYTAQVLLDSTGIGDPIYDDLLKMGVNAVPYRFTNQTKRQLIENLSIQMDQSNVTFPVIEQLLNELGAFECKLSGTGLLQYSGNPDDSVISLALATWQVNRLITGKVEVHGVRETAGISVEEF